MHKNKDWELLRDCQGNVLSHPSGPLIQHKGPRFKFFPTTTTHCEKQILGQSEPAEIRVATNTDVPRTFWVGPVLSHQLNVATASQQIRTSHKKVSFLVTLAFEILFHCFLCFFFRIAKITLCLTLCTYYLYIQW